MTGWEKGHTFPHRNRTIDGSGTTMAEIMADALRGPGRVGVAASRTWRGRPFRTRFPARTGTVELG